MNILSETNYETHIAKMSKGLFESDLREQQKDFTSRYWLCRREWSKAQTEATKTLWAAEMKTASDKLIVLDDHISQYNVIKFVMKKNSIRILHNSKNNRHEQKQD